MFLEPTWGGHRPRIRVSASDRGTAVQGSGPHWGRTTGGRKEETAHTTRLVTPKGSADLHLHMVNLHMHVHKYSPGPTLT